jgi:hypothetical protein
MVRMGQTTQATQGKCLRHPLDLPSQLWSTGTRSNQKERHFRLNVIRFAVHLPCVSKDAELREDL